MAIVSSTYQVEAPEKDGRSFVVELHTDNLGKVHRRLYGPIGLVDYQAILNAYAVVLAAYLADKEAEDFIETGVLTLNYNTATSMAALLRAKYKDATDGRAAQIGSAILNAISSGQVTDAQVQAAFGLTTTQYNNAKANLQNLVNDYNAVQAAVGA